MASTESIKEEILYLLAEKPLTIAELCHRMKLPYTSVQQSHKELRDENKITKFDRRVRNARYVLGPNNGPKSIVPSVNWKGESVKLTKFHSVHKIPEGLKEQGHRVIKAWTAIATTAERLHSGVPDDVLVKRLNAQKVELANARASLETMVFFINQLLDQPKLWDIEALSQFPDDKDWKEFSPNLKEMYVHYYETKDSE